MHSVATTIALVALCLRGASAKPGPPLPGNEIRSSDSPTTDVFAASPAEIMPSDSPTVDVEVTNKIEQDPWTPTTSPTVDRESCRGDRQQRLARQDSTERLGKLRELMDLHNVAAYIVPSGDEHGSEYTALPDHRREWISSFTGSLGDAVVTRDAAALWTDSRYYLQADEQLDCNWILMKKGDSTTPSIERWLASGILEKTDRIGADPRLLSYTEWSTMDNYLASVSGPRLFAISENLVDVAWGADRPSYPNVTLEVLDVKYTGALWQEKIGRVRDSMRASGGDLLVVSALDDGAWLLNLRGAEVPYTPMFRLYIIVAMDSVRVYMPHEKANQLVKDHLRDPIIKVEIRDHQDIWKDLPDLAARASAVLLTSAAVYHKGASYAIYRSVPPNTVKFVVSPVLYMKAVKNKAEAGGMQHAHVKDAVALVQMLAQLAEEVPAGKHWDELGVVDALARLRWEQPESRGPSFDTIAAFGPNSALPHYAPTSETNLKITTDGLFMLDSGGQYLDGTTDVTRTVHFGKPTDRQVEIYTHLLKGCIDLASLRFPQGRTMQSLDVLLRAPLYKLGLQYGHGSTHGIGSYLPVHESFDYTYQENFFGSQEPGYYEKNKFGMRLENIVQVVQAKVKNPSDTTFYKFETTTLVPYERKLINATLLNADEVEWLNTYNQHIRTAVGLELLKQKKFSAHRWLMENTIPFS